MGDLFPMKMLVNKNLLAEGCSPTFAFEKFYFISKSYFSRGSEMPALQKFYCNLLSIGVFSLPNNSIATFI